MKNFRLFVLLFCVSILSFGAAEAANVSVSNSLDVRLSLAFLYTDASGAEVTQGWWYVDAGGETTVTLNADSTKPVYYAAFNKNLYTDSSTVKGPQAKGWLSYSKFIWEAGNEPGEPDAFESRFFKVPESGAVIVDGNSRGK
jgi:hypothetical protein